MEYIKFEDYGRFAVCIDVVYQWGAIMISFMSVSCVIVGDWEKSGVWAGGPKS